MRDKLLGQTVNTGFISRTEEKFLFRRKDLIIGEVSGFSVGIDTIMIAKFKFDTKSVRGERIKTKRIKNTREREY